MLVECPHCAEEVEIELENGLVFECPHCASDFEVESKRAVEVDYSDHF
jgi:Zn finger protein HypA/HybF involved in hydrogenase expression